MSAINFFEQFAAMNVNDSVKNVTVNKNEIKKSEKQQKNVKIEKQQKNVKIEKQQKKIKFIHGKDVILIRGQYKGYSGFVYEYFGSKMNVMIDDFAYVLAGVYGDRKVGDKINTQFGDSVIVSKVDSMYKICMNSKNEDGVKVTNEISLPRSCFIRLVSFVEDNIKKFAQFMKSEDGTYELVMLNLDYKRSYDNDDILRILSDILVSGKYRDIFGKIFTKQSSECGVEYYMVCESPKNKNDVNYFGRYGNLSCEIAEQYLVAYKRIVKVNTTVADVDEKRVCFQRGVYKDKTGELLEIESAYLNVQINAIGKTVTNHLVKTEGGFNVRKIVPEDVFYCDIELKDGSYFQVKECYEDRFVGNKRGSDVTMTIFNDEVVKFMSGFTILSSMVSSMVSNISEEEIDVKNMFVMDTIEESEETDDVDEEDVDNYGDDKENDVRYENEYENTEGEMKASFKDTERSFMVQRTFTKDEKEYLKMIEKCTSVIGEVSNVFTLLDCVNDAVEMMKGELTKISVSDWKNTDVKYIVACLVAYDLVHNGYNMSVYNFKKIVEDLYEIGYITKNTISNSAFIRSDIVDGKLKKSCWNCIQMSNDCKVTVKNMYKQSKYLDIVKIIMENCNIVLQNLFGKVTFGGEDSKIELIPVSKPHTVREYPKYFLTTQDIIDNVTVDSAKKILWGPKSQTLINIWKQSLNKKLEKESNVDLKEIYTFVIENLDNAPFVLRSLESSEDKMDKLKYRELKRSFDTFTVKLKTHVEKKRKEHSDDLEKVESEKARINKRRLEISKNNMNLDNGVLVN
jgi:hypothetical protein